MGLGGTTGEGEGRALCGGVGELERLVAVVSEGVCVRRHHAAALLDCRNIAAAPGHRTRNCELTDADGLRPEGLGAALRG